MVNKLGEVFRLRTRSGAVYWGDSFSGSGAIPGVTGSAEAGWLIRIESLRELRELLHLTHWRWSFGDPDEIVLEDG